MVPLDEPSPSLSVGDYRARSDCWRVAIDALENLVGPLRNLLPDEIAEAAAASGRPLHWSSVALCDDVQVWAEIRPAWALSRDDEVIFIPDLSFTPGIGPFRVPWASVDTWIADFVDQHKDQVFGGDAIVISSLGCLVVHHEGMVAQVSR